MIFGIQRASKYQLVPQYSKSVNGENSKCLDFMSVQVKPMLDCFYLGCLALTKWQLLPTIHCWFVDCMAILDIGLECVRKLGDGNICIELIEHCSICIDLIEQPILQTGHFFSHAKQNEKTNHI